MKTLRFKKTGFNTEGSERFLSQTAGTGGILLLSIFHWRAKAGIAKTMCCSSAGCDREQRGRLTPDQRRAARAVILLHPPRPWSLLNYESAAWVLNEKKRNNYQQGPQGGGTKAWQLNKWKLKWKIRQRSKTVIPIFIPTDWREPNRNMTQLRD